MEERKKIIIALALAIVLILLTAGGIGFYFYWQALTAQPQTAPEPLVNTPLPGSLPPASDTENPAGQDAAAEQLAKEKQFISAFWQATSTDFIAAVSSYSLPLANIKEQILNYRDFSRKIDLTPALEKLSSNGFVVMADPFKTSPSTWENGYRLIKENNLPIFITADSILGVYQNTLQVVYKEIEQEIFYPSLWELLKNLFDQVNQRYLARHRQFGIETDVITEANRLELAYLTVALKLLQPEAGQVKESFPGDKKFFSPQEAGAYAISIPLDLANEVSQEIELIKTKANPTLSPLFLYQKDYRRYAVPENYNTSERLKNYYLALTWLNDSLFPLWNKEDDCPDCLLDAPDQMINFAAALYLSADLAQDQNLKNRWANIYKPISFFKGLEANLTYLDYHQALIDAFGPDYKLDEIITNDLVKNKEELNKVREKINAVNLLSLLSGAAESKEQKGLRLLRRPYLPENKIFASLTAGSGAYLKGAEERPALPFTACLKEEKISRCFPTGLDIFYLLNNPSAKTILAETKNDNYEFYEKTAADLAGQLKKFDQTTWHDNSYLALLNALTSLAEKPGSGWPVFMQNQAWQKKSLNLALAGWTNEHREINFATGAETETAKISSYFPYGYLEPQIKFYNQLLANIDMAINGFSSLQVISSQDKSFTRLKDLKALLKTAVQIAKAELENTPLSMADYNFINNFSQTIKTLTGDVLPQSRQNQYTFSYPIGERDNLNEYLIGLDYLIAIYTNPEGKLFFALGPVFNYNEGKNDQKGDWAWQKEFQVK